VPEPPATLVEKRAHDMFVELVVTAKKTVLVNPLIGTTVIVELLVTPTFIVTLVGSAVMKKS